MEYRNASERIIHQGQVYHDLYFAKNKSLNEIVHMVPWSTSESEIISVLQAYTDISKDYERRKIPMPKARPCAGRSSFVKLGMPGASREDRNHEQEEELHFTLSLGDKPLLEISMATARLKELLSCIL